VHPHYPLHVARLQSLLLTLRTISPSPLAASVERHCEAISVAPPPNDVIGENSDDLLSHSLSLSPSYHDDLPSPGAAAPPHGRESTMDREPAVVDP
jgi:hypothetical protein